MTTRSVDMLGMQPLRMTMRSVDMLGMGTDGTGPLRRHRMGAGALVAVLLLAALAGTGLAVHYAAQHAARQVASSFEAGRVFGEWVLAAHRASQEHGFALRLETEPRLCADASGIACAWRRAAGVAGAGGSRRHLHGRHHGRRARGTGERSGRDGLRCAGAGTSGGSPGLCGAGPSPPVSPRLRRPVAPRRRWRLMYPPSRPRWGDRLHPTHSTSRRTQGCATTTGLSTGVHNRAGPG